MNLYNIKHPEEQVSFAQGVRQGLGKDQGLFFPEVLPKLDNVDTLLDLPLVERSQKILLCYFQYCCSLSSSVNIFSIK